MGRTLRTNSSGGASSSSAAAGLTLDDISTAFDAPRLIKTIDITSPTGTPSDPIKFTNLDTAKYAHFRLRIDHIGGQYDANWITAGPMYGATQHNPSNYAQGYWRATSTGSNNQGSGQYYLANAYDLMYGVTNSWSSMWMTWDFYWCDPSVAISNDNQTISGHIAKGCTYQYADRGYTEHFEWRGSQNSFPDGFWIAAQQGFSKPYSNNSPYPMKLSLYGNERRTATA